MPFPRVEGGQKVVKLTGAGLEIDFLADNPGPALFHCHMQDHQDFGFMALVKYG